jgi:hypothetical protein
VGQPRHLAFRHQRLSRRPPPDAPDHAGRVCAGLGSARECLPSPRSAACGERCPAPLESMGRVSTTLGGAVRGRCLLQCWNVPLLQAVCFCQSYGEDFGMTRTSSAIEKAAEAHFFIRPQIDKALRAHKLTDDARAHFNQPWKTYHEVWTAQMSDKFHDMTTMIRLGSAIETELRDLYMRLKGHANLLSLKADTDFNKGTFQRIKPWQTGKGSALATLNLAGYDLLTNHQLPQAQQVMLHRHLYAHNIGVIDDEYIDDWKRLTGEDLLPVMTASGYPAQDAYWFRPLTNLATYIENLRKFVRDLP